MKTPSTVSARHIPGREEDRQHQDRVDQQVEGRCAPGQDEQLDLGRGVEWRPNSTPIG